MSNYVKLMELVDKDGLGSNWLRLRSNHVIPCCVDVLFIRVVLITKPWKSIEGNRLHSVMCISWQHKWTELNRHEQVADGCRHCLGTYGDIKCTASHYFVRMLKPMVERQPQHSFNMFKHHWNSLNLWLGCHLDSLGSLRQLSSTQLSNNIGEQDGASYKHYMTTLYNIV